MDHRRPVVELTLRPMAEDPVAARVEGSRTVWKATTIDPILIGTAPGGARIDPGWYRATARIHATAGEIEAPSFYLPGARNAYSEDRRVIFERSGGRWSARFFLDRSVRQLRFDPSCKPCEFTCELRLDPVGEPLRRRVSGWVKGLVAPPPSARPASRKRRVLSNLDKRGAGIEIGPSIDPIAPKAEGFRVHVIDHMDRAALIEKYADDPVYLDRIEEVDFVWKGESYAELTGRPKHYDWIIASHVIEHTPDLVAFLADCDSILKDDGVLSLVVPDKRYSFDRFRPITGLGRVVDAHLSARRSPTPGAIAEHHLHAVLKGNQLAWYEGAPGGYNSVHTAPETRQLLHDMRETGAYKDVHNWCFVPHSFRVLIEDLNALGYTQLREVSFHPTEGSEFYITLGRRGRGPRLPREELLRATELELAPVD